jgi:glycosyltransferase involved in cell wall biosynthesis
MLVTHRFLPDEAGGVEQYTQSLGTELVRGGDVVTIATRRFEHGRNEARTLRERLPDGILLFRLLAGKYHPDRFLEGQPEIERLFAAAILESAPDVVHINHLMGFSPGLIRIAHRLGAAVVVSLHDFYFACPRIHLQKTSGELCAGSDHGRECAESCFSGSDRFFWGLRSMLFERALSMAERVIAYSRHVAAYFRQQVLSLQIEVIENGVLPDGVRRESAPTGGAPFTLAYCGTIAPHKGPHIILDALRLARLESVRLLLIGQTHDSGYRARLCRDAAAIPGLQLQWYGQFSRRELPLLLAGVDCVIVPSLVPEAGPIVPREALAAGVPVVASRLGALPELIVEGESGLIFDPEKPAELAAILDRMCREPELLPRLRDGARRSPVVTVVDHAARVRAVYHEAVRDFAYRPHENVRAAEFDFLKEALLDRVKTAAVPRTQPAVAMGVL